MKIIGIYKISYPDMGVIQIKNLVSLNDYLNDIKVKEKEIIRLEGITPKSKTNERIINELKTYIKQEYGTEYFVENSPIWKSQFNDGQSMPLPFNSQLFSNRRIKIEITKL